MALLEAMRPQNMAMAALAVVLGAVLSGGPGMLTAPMLGLAAVATALSLAAGNLWNDLSDETEDRQNRPDRPIPSGRLDRTTARQAAALLALAALAVAQFQGFPFLVLVLACLALLAWYSRRGKLAGLAGNVGVAVLGAVAVLYGAWSALFIVPALAEPGRALVAACLAGLLHMMRELVKDAQDREGDRQAGRRTWALHANSPALRRLLAQLAVMSVLPPLLRLMLAADPPILRLAHLAALFVAPLLLKIVLETNLDSSMALARLSSRIKAILAGGIGLYMLAACWT